MRFGEVKLVAVALAGLLSTSAFAQSSPPDDTRVMSASEAADLTAPITADTGVGVSTCAEFAEAYRSQPEATELVYFSWAQGMMAGENFIWLASDKPPVDVLAKPLDDQKAYLRSYCDAHPLVRYSQAVSALLLSMQ